MRIPKRYGDGRVENCPFCGKIGISKNKQGVPVCANHKDVLLENFKCACGSWLDLLEGKWGPYFRCMNCGNINFKKGLEMNVVKDKKNGDPKEYHKSNRQKFSGPTETVVRSDQLDLV